ncbi:MAG: hypothetical protein EA420_06145, partial [Candidatus Competibacteraceae bacterium]
MSLRGQHVDLIRLDVGRLATVVTLVAGALTRYQQRRFTRREVMKIVVEAIHHDLLSVSALDPRMREEIENAVAFPPDAGLPKPSSVPERYPETAEAGRSPSHPLPGSR